MDNTLWANTVLASDTIIGLVLYTGKETRSVLNTSQPSNKVRILLHQNDDYDDDDDDDDDHYL